MPSSVKVKNQLQRPDIRVRDPSTNTIVDHIKSDVPDLVSFHGAIVPASRSVDDATLSFSFRRGQPFPGTRSLTWTINCEHGEVRLSSPSSLSAEDKTVTIQVHSFDDDKVEDVDIDWSDAQDEIPLMARSVRNCLYAFADGRAEGDGWVSIEDAANHSRLIQKFLDT